MKKAKEMGKNKEIKFEGIVISDHESEMIQEHAVDYDAEMTAFNALWSRHTNRLGELEKQRRKHWEHFYQVYDLDDDKTYQIKFDYNRGRHVLLEKKEDE